MNFIKKYKQQKRKEQQLEIEKREKELQIIKLKKEEKIKEEQLKELNSEKFKEIYKFVNEYKQRKFLNKEKELFNLIKCFIKQCEQEAYLSKNYRYKMNAEKERLNILTDYINNLTEEEKESNIYLKTACQLLEQSNIDCNIIIEKILDKINSQIIFNEMSSTKYIDKIYQIQIPIKEDSLKILLKPVRTLKYIYYQPYENKKEYQTSFMKILDEENIKYYETYNEIVVNIHTLAAHIYRLRNSQILSNYLNEDTHEIELFGYTGEIIARNITINTEDYNNLLNTSFSVDIKQSKKQENTNEQKPKVLKRTH